MNVRKKLLSLLLAGVVAFTSAGVGAVAAPGNVALAVSDTMSYDSDWSFAIKSGSGDTHSIMTGVKDSGAPTATTNGDAYVNRGATINFTASTTGSLSLTDNTHEVHYDWSLAASTNSHVHFTTQAAQNAVTEEKNKTSVGIQINAVAPPTAVDTVVLTCNMNEYEKVTGSFHATIKTLTVTIKATEFLDGTYSQVIDPDGDTASLTKYSSTSDGSYSYYVTNTVLDSTTFKLGYFKGETFTPGPAIATPGSYVKLTSSNPSVLTVNEKSTDGKISVTPFKTGSATITAQLYQAANGKEADAKPVAGSSSSLAVTVGIQGDATILVHDDTKDIDKDSTADIAWVLDSSDSHTMSAKAQTSSIISGGTLDSDFDWRVQKDDGAGNKSFIKKSEYDDLFSFSATKTTATVQAKKNFGAGTYFIIAVSKNSSKYKLNVDGEPIVDGLNQGTDYARFELSATAVGAKIILDTKTVKVEVDKSAVVNATMSSESYINKSTTNDAGEIKTWTVVSSDKEIAVPTVTYAQSTVADFAPAVISIKGVKNGTATVTVTATTGVATIVYTEDIAVTVGDAAPETVPVVSFTANNYTVDINKTLNMASAWTLTGAKQKAGTSATYSITSGGDYATVTTAGVVTAKAAGSATLKVSVTAEDGSTVTGTTTIQVKSSETPSSVSAYYASASYSVAKGATSSSAIAPVVTGTDYTVTYSIDKPSVATVDAATGKVTGVSVGTARLTATITPKTGSAIKVSTDIVVTGKLAFDRDVYTVAEGEYVYAEVINATNPVFSISPTSVATVNSSTGRIYGVAAGTAMLKVTSGNQTATATVTVTASVTPTPEPEPAIPSVPEFDYTDGSFTLYSNGTAAYLGSIKNSGTVTVPSYVTYKYGTKTYTYKVTRIADYAFSKSKVKKVKIPATVTQIGYKAFFKCPNLEKVAFEDASNIDDIEDKAFKKTREGCILKQKNGEKFDSDLKSWLEKTFKQIVIK